MIGCAGEKGDSLSREARRERAASAAMSMARMFADEELDEANDDEEEEQVPLS